MAKSTRFAAETIDEYMQKGYWSQYLAVDFWDRNAKAFPDKEAIVDSELRFTWSQAKQQIDRVALGLIETGIKRDQVIVAQLPNRVEFFILSLACEKAGILCAIAPTTLRDREIEYVLQRSNAVAIVIPTEFRKFNYFEMVQELRPRLPQLKRVFVTGDETPEGAISFNSLGESSLEGKYPPDYLEGTKFKATEVSSIFLTSGTTGMPKLVEVLSCSQMHIGRSLAARFKLGSDDIIAALSPISGGPGLTLPYYSAPQVGAKIALVESFESGVVCHFIEREKITVAGTVPTILSRLANTPHLEDYDFTSLRAFLSGGAPLPYQVAVSLEQKMCCCIVNEYGAIDIGNLSQASVDDSSQVRLLTVGKPQPGLEVRMVDETGNDVPRGEVGGITVRGPTCLSGYYLDPEATSATWTRDGWGKTGDLGRWDEQGNLVITGRVKDMIIRGGQNIYPQEVESLLIRHPKVLTAAIVGMPDPEMGERCCAYVVPKPGEVFTFEEIVGFLRKQRVASYKLPERLEIVELLPMVGGLKVDKKALSQDILEKLKQERQEL